MSKYVAWFKDLNKDSIAIAGGKGANLAEMVNLHLPVPNGFAVTAQCYREFTNRTKITEKIQQFLQGLNIEDTDTLQQRADQIQKLISSTPVPEDIAEDIMINYELLGAEKEATTLVESKEVFVKLARTSTLSGSISLART